METQTKSGSGQLKEKIEVLKLDVFPKKKQKVFEIHRKKIFQRKSMMSLNPCQIKSPLNENYFEKLLNNRCEEKKNTIEIPLEREKKNQIPGSWTMQSWFTKNQSQSCLKRRKPTIFKDAKQIFDEIHKFQSFHEEKCRGFRVRDTQTLIRKNSLYFLNFKKTKEKKHQSNPHLGNYPLTYNQNKNKIVSLHQELPVKQKNKKKRPHEFFMLEKKKSYKKQQSDNSKFNIYPQPW